MRINKFVVQVDTDKMNVLVKDKSLNYCTESKKINSPESVVTIINECFHLDKMAEEYLILVCMTSDCKPIGFFELSHGNYNSTFAGCIEVMIRALLCGAAQFVVVHNHPSGNAKPSSEDEIITKRLQEAAKLIGIEFSDHIIIGDGCYWSFREEGKICSN